jgi:hypothetical protein
MTDHPDSVRTATNRNNTVVIGEKLDYDGTANYFETDQAFGTTPTLTMSLTNNSVIPISKFLLTEVNYQLDPTNAVTYQLYLLEAASADDYQSAGDVIFDSGAAQADNTHYLWVQGGSGTTTSYKLPRIVNLSVVNTLYYMIDWSGAPGDTKGYIKIRGYLLK